MKTLEGMHFDYCGNKLSFIEKTELLGVVSERLCETKLPYIIEKRFDFKNEECIRFYDMRESAVVLSCNEPGYKVVVDDNFFVTTVDSFKSMINEKTLNLEWKKGC